MPRKNVSISKRHEKMVKELKQTGVFDRVYGGFSGMVQRKIEEVYNHRMNPAKLELKMKREEKRRLEEQINRLDEKVGQDQRKKSNEKDDEEFFEKFIEKVIEGKGKKSFQKQYEKWEEGNMKKFAKKHHPLDKKTFREKAQKVAKREGYDLEF